MKNFLITLFLIPLIGCTPAPAKRKLEKYNIIVLNSSGQKVDEYVLSSEIEPYNVHVLGMPATLRIVVKNKLYKKQAPKGFYFKIRKVEE